MPLIIMCGIPSSGKSTRAQEIAELLKKESPDNNVTIVIDDFSSVARNKLYSSSKEEKISRSNLKSKVKFLCSRLLRKLKIITLAPPFILTL